MSRNELNKIDSTFDDKSEWSLLLTAKPNVPEDNTKSLGLDINVATEDHLQSLGLDINDGLPKFRFNEPGPAALASSIFQQNNVVNDETEQSFVVLGKTSLESVRETSLASYMKIQEKSNLTDHSNLLSMMTPSEIEENLKKVLQENIKLKETLKQNNDTIKKRFNNITLWQKEVMTVCDSHKKKFLETKELISRLKKENDELRGKIAKNQFKELFLTSNSSSLSPESSTNSLISQSNNLCAENISVFPNFNFEQENVLQNSETQLNSEQELLKKIDTLSEELSNIKMNHSKTQEILTELEKRYATDIQLFSQQLQKANKELEIFKQKSDSSDTLELQKLINKCFEKQIEVKYLKEIITSLEQQIKKFEENNVFSLSDLQIETSQESSQEKYLLKENIDFYNMKIGELNKCYSSQRSRYPKIQEFLKESADIIQIFENAKLLSNDTLSEDRIKIYKDKLCDYRKKLIDEQLQSIDDKQATIKVQKQFQKILSDYNSVIYELEILKDENSKLATIQVKAAEENSQKLAEIEKHLKEEKKLLDNEKTSLLEERLNLQMEKKIFIEEKEKIEAERNSLLIEKEKLKEERTSFLEEKTSLDRQSRLYDAEEETLQKEKKTLQKKCEALSNQVDNLKQELIKANSTIQQLHIDNDKLKENEEIISVYKIQMEMNEKEFEQMQVNQKKLQDQLQSLSMINLKLCSENIHLGSQENEQ